MASEEDRAEAKRLRRLVKAQDKEGGCASTRRSPCYGCEELFPVAALKKCSVCEAAYYCGAECQKADWKAHKKECREAAAALVGAS